MTEAPFKEGDVVRYRHHLKGAKLNNTAGTVVKVERERDGSWDVLVNRGAMPIGGGDRLVWIGADMLEVEP